MPSAPTNRLLKAGQLTTSPAVVSYHFSEIQSQCDHELKTARDQAQQLLHEAELQAEMLRRDAHEIGHATGSLQAETEFAAAVEFEVERRVAQIARSLTPAMQQAAAQLAAEREQLLLKWEDELLELSVAIAERILQRELSVQPQIPRTLVTEMLRLATGGTQIELHLHPHDLRQIESQAADWPELCSPAAQVRLIGNPQIGQGGCVLHSHEGVIDGQVETQLNRLLAELRGVSLPRES